MSEVMNVRVMNVGQSANWAPENLLVANWAPANWAPADWAPANRAPADWAPWRQIGSRKICLWKIGPGKLDPSRLYFVYLYWIYIANNWEYMNSWIYMYIGIGYVLVLDIFSSGWWAGLDPKPPPRTENFHSFCAFFMMASLKCFCIQAQKL